MIDGTGVETGIARWGDYSSMEVDPADNCTFWYTTEYIQSTGSFNWSTRIGSFTIPTCTGSLGLGVSPSVHTLCSSTDATSFDIELTDPFTATTTLSVDNCPAGASCDFTVNPVVYPANTSVLNVTGLSGVVAGDYTLTVTATDPGNTLGVDVAINLFDALPAAPTPTAPGDGATLVDLLPLLEWGSVVQGQTYSVQVATDAGFANIIEQDSGLGGTSYQVSQSLDPVAQYYWRVMASNTCGDGTWSSAYSFTTRDIPPILLIDDDDNGPDVRAAYTDALDAMGLQYDVWDTSNSDNEPSSAEFTPYQVVIWFTGDEFGGAAGPGSASETALSSYLDGGGCLVLSSQDYLWDRGLTTFGQNYLGIADFASDVTQATVTGQNWFAGMGPYVLSYPFSNYSDFVVPDGTAEQTFLGNASGQEGAAVMKSVGNATAIFFGYPLEALPTQADMIDVLGQALNACGGVPFFADGFEGGNASAWSHVNP